MCFGAFSRFAKMMLSPAGYIAQSLRRAANGIFALLGSQSGKAERPGGTGRDYEGNPNGR
jgi:hypothetical protein